ncbi:MAG: hypothetical protein ACSHX8_09880 [Opitutaceae bacterium]
MKFSYQIIKEHKLVVEEVSGRVTLEGLAQKTNSLYSDPDYDPTFVGVADYRLATAQITRTELYGFAKFINGHEQFGQAKWAILADDPMVVAFSQIFQQRMIKTDVIEVFSTPEAAANYIGNPAALDYIKQYPMI